MIYLTPRAKTALLVLAIFALMGLVGTLDYQTKVQVQEEERIHARGTR